MTTQNKRRAKAAMEAVMHHGKAKGEGAPRKPRDPAVFEENLTDLLTDLQHLCAEIGIDFADTARIAEGHYRVESTQTQEEANADE